VLVRGQTWSLGWKIANQSQNAPSPFQCLESYSGTAKFTITSSRTEVKERERRSYRQDQRLSTALLYLTGHNPSISDGLQVAPCGDWACKRPGGVGSRIGVENFSPSTALRSHPTLHTLHFKLGCCWCLPSPMQMTRCFFRSLHHQESRAGPGCQQSGCGSSRIDLALQRTPPPPWSVLPGRDSCTTSSSRL
jgi:hypothetical protein